MGLSSGAGELVRITPLKGEVDYSSLQRKARPGSVLYCTGEHSLCVGRRHPVMHIKTLPLCLQTSPCPLPPWPAVQTQTTSPPWGCQCPGQGGAGINIHMDMMGRWGIELIGGKSLINPITIYPKREVENAILITNGQAVLPLFSVCKNYMGVY